MRGGGRLRAGAAGPSVWFFTRASGGRALARWCPDRAEVWEVALGVLPGSSGVLPGSPWLLPDRSRTFPVSSRLLPAPVLHTLFLPPTSGVHDVQSFSRVRASHEHAGRDHPGYGMSSGTVRRRLLRASAEAC